MFTTGVFVDKRPCLTAQEALTEAARCTLCLDTPCSAACPAGTDPGTFVRQMLMRNLSGAIRTVRGNNILAGVCAQVCPTSCSCEAACVRTRLDGRPVAIANIQGFIVQQERALGVDVLGAPSRRFDERVAVIGGGPAGLAAAASLAERGYRVTLFERGDRLGGVVTHSIPAHRLDPNLAAWEAGLLQSLGVDVQLNADITGEQGLQRLEAEGFAAAVVATGLDRPLRVAVPGDAFQPNLTWDQFLPLERTGVLRELVQGKSLVVIGGGSVAVDCAVSARRAGARAVTLVSLEDMDELPATREELAHAFNHGIRFQPQSRVEAFLGEGERLTGVRGVGIRWREPGRFTPDNAVIADGATWQLPADIVVQAIGTARSHENSALLQPITDRDGRLAVDRDTHRSRMDRVFVVGDVLEGGTVVEAVAGGKQAAASIDLRLKNVGIITRSATPDLSIEFCGVRCPNPFFLSSSPVSNTAEMVGRAFEAGWGGVAFKTIGRDDKFRIVDPSPRLNAYHCDDKRFVGLQNLEQITERPLEVNLDDLTWLRSRYPDRVIIASIMGYDEDDWTYLAGRVEEAGAHIVELNFSCPQMAREGAGHAVGQSEELVERYTAAARRGCRIPVMPKMTPNVADMVPIALAAKRGGASAIAAINTIRAISAIDLQRVVPRPTVAGQSAISGFSGQAARPIALRFIAEMAKCTGLSLPISAMGGMASWTDAAEFLLLGASTLQVTTGVMRYGQWIVRDLVDGLGAYMREHHWAALTDMVGQALPALTDPAHLDHARQVVSSINRDTCIGCGQCVTVCQDAANQALSFDSAVRRPSVDETRCVGCMLCSHVCPVWDCIQPRETGVVVTSGMHQDALALVSGRRLESMLPATGAGAARTTSRG
jgi:dihydropyrimidine dehydrogenase (NAD+) subunit PreA